MQKRHRLSSLFFILFFLLLISGQRTANAAQPDCLKCHGELVKKKVVHPAIEMGCTACHSGIDASAVPHKITGKTRLGLFADVPDLCFSCHGRKMFEGKDVHPPVAGGMCTMCHDPHSENRANLLVASFPGLCFTCHDKGRFTGKEDVHPPVAAGLCIVCHEPHRSGYDHLLMGAIPQLCYQCHDTKQFTKKYVHPPVAEGQCLTCHRPHEAGRKFLLVKKINKLCLGCHAEVVEGVHAVETFGPGGGHPVETRKAVVVGGKKMKLSCVSCHNPHSSPWRLLFQFQPPICEKCHHI
jgi:predicted CXXCH cytochrome family protein